MESNEDDCGGEVYTWGSAQMGQLGYPPSLVVNLPKDSQGFPYQPVPLPTKSLSTFKIVQIAGGDGHSLAVTHNGRVYSWGASACGQLGLSRIELMPKDSQGYPYHPEPKLIQGLLQFKIIMVACGDAHTAALTSEGIILTWGGGGCGQLGHPDTQTMPKDDDGCPFQPQPRFIDSLNVSIKHISCGKAHTVAISEQGLVYTWGAGACGQLGHADMSSFPMDQDGYPFHPTPKMVSALKKHVLKMSACGDVHTLVLQEDGRIFCFGGGSFGQLGLGNIQNLPVDVDECPYMPIPKVIQGLKNSTVTQIACGDSHSMALLSTGELYGWGAAACGQLGIEIHLSHCSLDPDNKPYVPEPRLITELRGKKTVSISCGQAHTLVLISGGFIYSFGANNCGQLGIGYVELNEHQNKSINCQSSPKLITGLLGKRVASIACGGVHNIIITEPIPKSLASNLYSCYQQGLYTDLVFRLGSDNRDQQIACHKVVVASRSAYLRELVKSQDNIKLEYSFTCFSKLIEYLYKDDIESVLETLHSASFNQTVQLLQISNLFQLQQLQQACQTCFMQQFRPHFPDQTPLMSQVRNLVFLPDGRAAILSASLYNTILDSSIILENSCQNPQWDTPNNRSVSISKDLFRELNNPELSDVTLIVENKPIYSHKVILSARSEYFSALYSHGFREAKQGIVQLNDVNYADMLNMLKLMYTDEAEIDLQNVIPLLTLCERFSVISVKQKCEAALAPTLTIENAAMLYKYAKIFSCSRLREICLCFIDAHFSEVIKTTTFEDLDKDSIIEIMRFNKNV